MGKKKYKEISFRENEIYDDIFDMIIKEMKDKEKSNVGTKMEKSLFGRGVEIVGGITFWYALKQLEAKGKLKITKIWQKT